MDLKDRTLLGLTEKITLFGHDDANHTLMAKVDTGASKSSIALNLALNLKLGPVVESRLVKSAHGSKLRPVVAVYILLGGRKLKAKFTLADRGHMKYKVLIGENILKRSILVDPSLRSPKEDV